ncbi:sigma 54-interacting transcriptional regulator [Trabulsiella odontotermitis]|uniref:sigma 54-interacting transcriptional regulator n=1 Tax=Trabulsiella odontotermitis TaxID=379893 RepID=UPI0006761C1D|nr:sigma 54-interacting transcriptional regulator [Trabulsiella odontotermitis]KNC92130.1 hypothetical protein GM30_19045 [Trabulsiella odontotermitis]
MNKMKKKLCVIGLAEVVCDAIGASLRTLIGEYADILCWCLEKSMDEQIPTDYDLYLATYPGSYAYAKKMLPNDCQILLAGRFVNPSNFERLLELPKNTSVLAVDNSLERANYLIWEIARFGVNHLNISPYYPDCPEPEKMAQSFAVGAGRKRNVPDWMEFINLGVKELTITTYARILQILDIPEEVLDSIVHTYMDSVFQMARRNNNTRTYLHSIINNIDEIIFGIDENGGLFFKNNAAESLIASLGKTDGASLRFGDIFSELDRPFAWYCENCDEEIITKINGLHYVLQIKPVSEPVGGNIGTLIIVKPVTRVQELENKVRRKLKGTGLTAKYTFANILGESPAIRQAVDTARRFAGTPLTVLLESESGTGKELFAQSIHQASACASGPFVAFNFSALPETLAESELFGYEEGAFTGARRGGRNKQFRKDLFYRLCMCPLYIPPLRERTGDVLFLIRYFAETLHSRHLKFDSALEDFCNTYDWPGNVRELQNMVTYLCAVVPPNRVCTTADLPRYFHSASHASPAVEVKAPPFTAIYEEMVNNHTLDICRTLLAIFNEKTKGHSLGREHIFDMLKDHYPAITHPALRRHLDTLKYHGMLHSGSTKQGTDITPVGREFLAWIVQLRK